MSGFLYFADSIVNPLNEAFIPRLGLSHAFDAMPMHGVINDRTPSGRPGTLIANQSRLGNYDLAFRGDDQVWRKRPGDDCVWVGYWTASPPTPDDLALDKQLAGPLVALADGREWKVPRLEWFLGDDGFQLALPRYYDLSPDGNWICGEVDEAYRYLNELADRLHAGVFQSETEGGQRLTTEELLDLAPRLLGVNYAVGALECAMLRLFKRGNSLMSIAKAAVDWGTTVEWLKKNEVPAARAMAENQ